MKPALKRVILNAKDVMVLTGRRERAAYHLMAQIKKQHNKSRHSMLTIDEFCEYTGIRPERVLSQID